MNDTIAAIATVPQAASRGVIRVSGPDTIAILAPWFTSQVAWTTAKQARVFDGDLHIEPGRTVPGRLYLWPNHRSYTRQPTAELHTIGALPLLSRVLHQLCESGARLAEPGEFTLRAFLSGRLDLTQAEAVLGVIDAENEGQLRTALGQLAGGLARQLTSLRDDLLNLIADLEAGLDFVEDDIQFITPEQTLQRIQNARHEVSRLLTRMTTRGTSVRLPKVVLVGSPNVGKSSLLNALADAPVAIVSSHSGTTRDYVTHTLELGDVACELLDTAGFTDIQEDNPDARAQTAARESSGQASARLICLDASRCLRDDERECLGEVRVDRDIVVLTKADLPRKLDLATPCVITSATTGQGLDELRARLRQRIEQDVTCRSETLASTNARCQLSLGSCLDHLQTAEQLVNEGRGDELIASEMRLALDELGRVAGVVYTDDILDRIFSRFCIGK